MTEGDRIHALFLEEFEVWRSEVETALSQPSAASMYRAVEVVNERHGRLEVVGYLRAGYGLGVLDVPPRLDIGEAQIDRVLERARGLPN